MFAISHDDGSFNPSPKMVATLLKAFKVVN